MAIRVAIWAIKIIYANASIGPLLPTLDVQVLLDTCYEGMNQQQ